MRAKIAKKRNKHHLLHLLSTSENYNYHNRERTAIENEICDLLPSRRNWKKLSAKNRYTKNGAKINSIDKNIKSLITTIKWYESNDPNADFLIKLNAFINKVHKSIDDLTFELSKPYVIPVLKESKKTKNNICRPISNYGLLDKIIISLTNKYFTDLFDGFFYHTSLAFRAPKTINGKKVSIEHHDALKRIKNFIGDRTNQNLWVSECDMKKFFDTVDHNVIETQFNRIMLKVYKTRPEYFDNRAINIFRSYLNSYAFNKDVLTLNTNQDYFKEHGIEDGEFGWVEDEILNKNYYKSINNERIGIPQGGALSGLIANIVLNVADKNLSQFTDSGDFLYLRYCDDMLIVCSSKSECRDSKNLYYSSLEKLRLVPHSFKTVERNNKDYWKTKSKEPYLWDQTNGIKWIGFVGYEINREGEVRIRKSSLKKEMTKQFKVINEARKAIKDNQRRVKKGYIKESIVNRLIGMSVGRISLWNYDIPINDLCWINGFSEVNKNSHSSKQHRALDRNRNKHFRNFMKELEKMPKIEHANSGNTKSRRLIYYGKPFSYFYQSLEKKMK